jgi:mRNA-degrading endonuclease toxin of MazEF toxin-antitoxin module
VIYSRWDIVAVEFPFVEATGSKRRPGLIVSSDRLYGDYGWYWIAMITTAKRGHLSGDIAITSRERVNLPEDCFIRTAYIATVSDAQISRKIGSISAKDRIAVSGPLKRFMP